MWEQIRSNRRSAAMLVVAMAGLLLVTGYSLFEALLPGGGPQGLILAFVVWAVLSVVSYYQGDSILLPVSGARPVSHEDHPVLYNVVEEMSIAAGLPKPPAVYIIDDEAPNAFAVGRSPEKAVVAVTSGLLKELDRDELQGVVAHELAHVKNCDVLYMTMLGVMMGAIVLLSDFGSRILRGSGRSRTSCGRRGGKGGGIILLVAVLLAILAPIFARLIYLAVSRRREYLADACSAQFTRYPEGLASALLKISGSSCKLQSATRATAALYISNPLETGKALSSWSSTHPPIESRVNILRAMAGAGLGEYAKAMRQVVGAGGPMIPAAALAGAGAVPLRGADSAGPGVVERTRSATDALWKLNGYFFVECPCRTKLKVPREYAGRTLACPHCGAQHPIPRAV